MAGGKPFVEVLEEKRPPVLADVKKDDADDIDLGPCAARANDRYITALEIRHGGEKPWEAFQYKDISTRSEFSPTRFVVVFEGREERWKVVVKGRKLYDIYKRIVQGRIEWIEAVPPARDFAKDGEMVITSIEVVPEKVK
jgi:hypothetical protein